MFCESENGGKCMYVMYLFLCFVLCKQPSYVNPTQGVINEAPGSEAVNRAGATSQSNLKMKHLGLLISAKIFQISFLIQSFSGLFLYTDKTTSSYPLIKK